MVASGLGQPRAELGEELRGAGAVPVGGQQVERQTGVGVGQPPPVGQQPHVVGERLLGVVAQFEQALHNLLIALSASGGRPDQLASLTIFIVDMDDYKSHTREIGAVWRRLVGADYPAMAGIGVARLWDEDALVELQGFAVLE